ncbi:MAG: Txe/YoeB family addiction module toxin [Bacteroidia bacterium]|nr:Txe/YoeB family addiction module toxin [Bacteroidia bacterium]
MNLVFTSEGWEEYEYWQKNDTKTLRKINELIKACTRDPFEGIGKPEPLKGELQGFWSRRITGEHRLVYQISEDGLQIIQCRFHY